MTETPKTVEVNVVMGAQTRAIVRSALLHVRDKMKEKMRGTFSDATTNWLITDVIDAELEKWPLSADDNDTLPEWLEQRFGTDVPEEDKTFWEHEAAAVRRAVGRGGFKQVEPLPDNETEISRRAFMATGLMGERHDAVARTLHTYKAKGNIMVSIQQVLNLLAGQSKPEEYSRPLQVRPYVDEEKVYKSNNEISDRFDPR